jgi:hypothetical protein
LSPCILFVDAPGLAGGCDHRNGLLAGVGRASPAPHILAMVTDFAYYGQVIDIVD